MHSTSSQPRERFHSRWGFILACIGSAVGMGNLWRFPVLVSQYGGLTFLLPYCFFVLLIASTGVISEFALGRFAGTGPVGAFGRCTKIRWKHERIGNILGIIPVVGSLALAIGYTVVMGWIFRYTALSFTGKLTDLGTNMKVIGSSFASIAPESNTLFESVQLLFQNGPGNASWLLIGLIASLWILALGVRKGIERVNKILMPLLFFLLIALAIYLACLPNAHSAYRYLFSFRPQGLSDPKVWLFAFGQAFFSLSVAGNGSVIYGSYLSKKENLVSSARNVACFDTLAAFLASLVILPAMAVGQAELSQGGPGLLFLYLVRVFNEMPGGSLVASVFFLCVLFAGISSIVNLYEAPIAFLQEKLNGNRISAVIITGGIGACLALAIQGITSQWMDLLSIYICPLGALLAAVLFYWVLPIPLSSQAVNSGKPTPIGSWFLFLGRYLYIPLTLLALLAGAWFGGIG